MTLAEYIKLLKESAPDDGVIERAVVTLKTEKKGQVTVEYQTPIRNRYRFRPSPMEDDE